MGLEAMHILQRGEHPIYYYGQNYMGVAEAYVGSLAFRLFGISVFTLRLGMITFFAIFLVSVCWLASLLYSRRVALVSLALLIIGTPALVQTELLADGGKVETLAFGALMFALATWLALSASTEPSSPKQRWLRRLAFFGWGLVAGLGLYTYMIIAPFVVTSALLLVITCRHELRSWVLALPIAGLLIGLLPVIVYTVTMPLAYNPLAVFLSLHQRGVSGDVVGVGHGWLRLVQQVDATLLYTLPTMTGLIVLFPVQALPLYGPPQPATVIAVIIGGGWSLVYLSLLGVATFRPVLVLRKRWMLRRMGQSSDKAAPVGLAAARLLLAFAAWLTIASYMISPTAARNPYSGRYMIGLLIVVPAILWPLVDGMRLPRGRWKIVSLALPPLLLLLMVTSQVAGAAAVVRDIPPTVALNQQDATFDRDLLSLGLTRFYSDYWTCDLVNFATRERVVCSELGNNGQPPGHSRYTPYDAEVAAEPHASFVLRRGSTLEAAFKAHIAASGQPFAVQYLDGYDIYTPLSASA